MDKSHIYYKLNMRRASLVAQMVKNLLQCKRLGFPVFLLGKSHGQRSLAGYKSWGGKESDMAEQ